MDVLAQLTSALFDRYRVEREIGRGGMATVYLARDLRHDRQVALKVLDPELGAVLGVERFLSEIKVTANLQHPNLLPLFDSGAVNGLLFYVMPFVEGESLRHRIDREKQLPVDDAVRIAIAIAGALEYAHGHGVIHRDLKPENILLQAGQPVIADFGIALAVSKAGGARVTQTGLSLGTPLYMSPEQATGDRVIDGRSDVYSLAAMTYEMLVGDPPHTASTAQAIIAKVLTEKPADVRVLRGAVSDSVAYAIHRALEKLPADRWATAAQFAEALQGRAAVVAGSRAIAFTAGTMEFVPQGRARRAPAIVLGASLVIAALGVWGWMNPRASAAPAPVRFDLSMPANAAFAGIPGTSVDFTPDARTLVYSGRGPNGLQLFRRAMDHLHPLPIVGTENAQHFTTSPDGRSVAFVVERQLRRVQLDAGAATTIAPTELVSGTSWATGDVIVLGSPTGGLLRVSASGGVMKSLTTPDTAKGESSHRWPRALPDGRTVLFTVWPRAGGIDSARIGIASLQSSEYSVLDVRGAYAFGVFAGYLVYARADGPIMAVAVDLRRRRVTGEPVLQVDSVVIGSAGVSKATLSPSGTLAYQVGMQGFQLVGVSARGAVNVLIPQLPGFGHPSFSPDGKKVALVLGWTSIGSIWVYDLAARTLSPLSAADSMSDNRAPAWTADGRRLAFESDRSGKRAIWWQVADGSAPAELLAQSESHLMEPTLSRDGRLLVYRKDGGARSQLWYRSLSGDTTPKTLGSIAAGEQSPSLSPDGRWLAYESAEAGPRQIFVRAFPGPPSKWAVSDAGGVEPRWAPDGRTIYYRSPQGIVAAHVRTSPTFGVVSRQVLFVDRFNMGRTHQNYDISPDGKVLAMVQRDDQARSIVVVSNWLTELRARMAGTRAP